MFFSFIEAAHYDGYSQKTFLEQVRRGFKMVKNRHNKNLCRHRQMERQRQEQILTEMHEIEDIVDIMPEEFIKTETII